MLYYILRWSRTEVTHDIFNNLKIVVFREDNTRWQ